MPANRSLLHQTVERLNGSRFAPAVIVSGEEEGTLIDEALRNADSTIEAILLEPVGRNTAAAAALAAAWLNAKGHDELILLMPSDHLISDAAAFCAAIDRAMPSVESGAIVTFGAKPTEANSQYGYIEANFDQRVGEQAYKIAKFHEKPDASQASEYLRCDHFFWNCGIFLVRVSTLIEEMQRYLPASMAAILAAVPESEVEGCFITPSADWFSQAENISIDHAIMEKTRRGVVLPVEMQWSDVGAWDAVWNLGEKDEHGNVIHGKVVAHDSRNSLLRADGSSTIAVIGLENMVVIAVDDAILVAPMERVAEIKALPALLNEKSGK